MSTMTMNHPNKACTVGLNRIIYNREYSVFVTYLNPEQIWPVRSTALEFAQHLIDRQAHPGWYKNS